LYGLALSDVFRAAPVSSVRSSLGSGTTREINTVAHLGLAERCNNPSSWDGRAGAMSCQARLAPTLSAIWTWQFLIWVYDRCIHKVISRNSRGASKSEMSTAVALRMRGISAVGEAALGQTSGSPKVDLASLQAEVAQLGANGHAAASHGGQQRSSGS